MYENIFTDYVKENEGFIVYALQGATVGLEYPHFNEKAGKYGYTSFDVQYGSQIMFTGYSFNTSNDVCFQVLYGDESWGFIWKSDISHWSKTIPSSGTGEGQNILNELIEYQKSILETNLLCARIINFSNNNGLSIPNEYKQNLIDLQTRLILRNQQIENSDYFDVKQKGTSPDFAVYNQELVDFMNNPGIGAFVVDDLVVIIILVVLVAGAATAGYALCKKLNNQAKVDFGYSNDLMAKLAKYLPADVLKQVLAENEANTKKANDAIKSASGNSTLNMLKYAGIGVLAIWGFDKFNNILKNGHK